MKANIIKVNLPLLGFLGEKNKPDLIVYPIHFFNQQKQNRQDRVN